MWALFIPGISLVLVIYLCIAKERDVILPRGNPVFGFLLCALIPALLISRIFWAPFWIPAGSMKPNLIIGDFITVTPVGPNLSPGDVLVFQHPVHGHHFIKRLIGKPGDKLQIVDGLVYINGVVASQRPDGYFIEKQLVQGSHRSRPRCTNLVGDGGICKKEQILEVLPNGHEQKILNIGSQRSDNTPVYLVPEGHYFFLGDNRDNSSDSRVSNAAGGVGFVPLENVVGRASRVVFSSAGSSMLHIRDWRKDRFFANVE